MVAVLVTGSGGREHALAWALSRSEQVSQVYVAPGNGGTTWQAGDGGGMSPGAACESIAIDVNDFEALIAFAREKSVDLTVVGPEVPLAAGIVDAFQAAGLRIFGPSQQAAQLEASKAYSKAFMVEQGIPTAAYGAFTAYDPARRFLSEFGRPAVVKADGLAAGKGVIVCDTSVQAEQALYTIMEQRAFGEAGETVLIEERLTGREVSVLAFSDGETAVPMVLARDHKRALDGDAGPNTGGMGAIAPSPDVTPEQLESIMQTVIQPAIEGMHDLGTPYIGVLYAGLMLTDAGIRVLEFNCRFGDPETQVILPLLKTDLYTILDACVRGTLSETPVTWHDDHCATVVLASPGYPGSYPKGLPISGLATLPDDVIVFHAGTQQTDSGIVTSGGRVLAVTARGETLTAALDRAYAGVGAIDFDDKHYRMDIGRTAPG